MRVLAGVLLAIPVLAQSPSFSAPNIYPVQTAPLAITAADFNGDGIQDIAVANSESETVSIFFGSGDGKFTPGPTIVLHDCEVGYVAAAKFSGAAQPDILAICPLAGFFVIPNTGKGAFGNPIGTLLPQGAWVGNLLLGSIHPALADFNGDGSLDIALPGFDSDNFQGYWFFMQGLGNGSFKGARQIPFVGVVPISIAEGDFNGDGKIDLVTATYTLSGTMSLEFAAGHGDGTFDEPVYTPLPVTGGSIVMAADVNGDGNLDVVIAGSAIFPNLLNIATYQDFQGDSAVTVLLGDGQGNFAQVFNATESNYMTGAVLAEIFAAGTLDLVETTIQANFYQSQLPVGTVSIRPGNGDGTFGNPIVLAVPSASTVSTDVTTADFNGDGKPDLALASFQATSVMIDTGLFGDFDSTLTSVLKLLPNGNAEVLLNQTVPSQFRNVNAASFTTGPLAKGSIVTAFGKDLAGTTAGITSLPLPTELGGDIITILDSSGASTDATLFYVSSGQINYAIPDTVASGPATITIHSGATALTASQEIVSVAPGIFQSKGLAVGSSTRLVNGVQQSTSLLDNNGAPVPIDVSGGGTYVLLYGTGIHNHTQPVAATVGGQLVAAAYAGPQGVYLGEDQINLLLPNTLGGAGLIPVSLQVDGQTSNSVQIDIK